MMVEKTSKRTFVFFRIIVIFFLFFIFNFFHLYSVYQNEESDSADLNYRDNFQDNNYRSRDLLSIQTGDTNCTPAAILEFPSDGLTKTLRLKGWIALHCLLVMYCFLLLANVCENYFVPAIQAICNRIGMTEDVAGATLMAVTSSSPELFINCVGTFVTKGDLGVGTVVGSAVFNILAVPACCGLFAVRVVELDWWPVSRDCLMYAISVIILIFTMQDDRIDWYEALFLMLAYTFYIVAMYFNGPLQRLFKSSCCFKSRGSSYTDITPLLAKDKNGQFSVTMNYGVVDDELATREFKLLDTETVHVWTRPEGSCWSLMTWFFTWPICLLLWLTIPNSRERPKLVAISFIMCLFYIGGTSYVVAWLITVIGDTFSIPDSVIGLTFLAAGMSVPEAVSSIIVTNQGFGSMGLSNSIGSNTFDVLLCLGLPWLIKTVWFPAVPGHHYIIINSSGLSYNTISLLSTLFALYGALMLNKFRLDWRIGVACGTLYLGFLILATLVEMNFFFLVNLPTCPH